MSSPLSDEDNFAVVWDSDELAAALDPGEDSDGTAAAAHRPAPNSTHRTPITRTHATRHPTQKEVRGR